MKSNRYYLLLVLSMFFSFSCSTDQIEIQDETTGTFAKKGGKGNPPALTYSVNRLNQYHLNVVFFKPSDYQVTSTLIDQTSDVMLYIQKWYEKQMELQGFGKKTFGLMTDQYGKVRIHVVEGQMESSSYSGHADIVSEIDQYFSQNPDIEVNSHLFVLGSAGSGVPFYGIGKKAFATSDDFQLTSTGQYLGDLELMVCNKMGGMMHELGHALNVPHCAHKASDLPNISLMSFGNTRYQNPGEANKIFLTKSDCAILDVCEVFNTKDNQYYNLSSTVEMGSYSVTKDATKQATIVQGKFTSDVPATHFYVGHNGYPLPGGYDNITFTVPVTPTSNANEYSFYVEMPYSDIFNGYQAKDILQLSMVTLDENGNRNTPVEYDYTIDVLSPEPNDDILKEYTSFVFSDRSNWTISASSTSSDSIVANAIDGDYSTYWHSAWPYSIATSGSHEITIDMGVSKQINGIYLFSDRNTGKQFRPKTVRVEISDDGVNWTFEKEETISSIEDAKEVSLNFTSSVVTKHIKLLISEVYSENTTDNLLLVEIDVL